MSRETEACLRLMLGRLERLATDRATRTQMLGVLDCLNAAVGKLQRAVLQRGQPALQEVTRFGRRYDELWCRGAIAGQLTLSGEFVSWMAQTAGDAWSQYLRESSACIRKLKGLDLGSESCGAGGCDPAFAAFLNDINRHLAADLLSCVPASNCRGGCEQPPPGREREPCQPPSDHRGRHRGCRRVGPAGTSRRREADVPFTPEQKRRLMRAYAPVLFLHRGERFVPISPAAYLERAACGTTTRRGG